MSALVLIADDDPKRLERLRHLVAGEGPNTVTANNAQEAMGLFVRRAPDLTLLQLDSSEDLGMLLCRDLKALGEGRRRFVVVVAPRTSRSAAFDAWCDAFVARQPDDQSILQTVRRFLATHRRPVHTGAIAVNP